MGLLTAQDDIEAEARAHKDGKLADRRETPKKIMDAVKDSYSRMEFFRKAHIKMVREYTGELYGAGSMSLRPQVMVNKLHQLVTTYLYLLASQDPKAMVTPDQQDMQPHAAGLELALNRLIPEIGLGETIQRAVLSAMFSWGVVKTGLAEGEEYETYDGWRFNPGQPFSALVEPDNFVIDMQAQSMEEIDYIGDRMLRSLEWVNEKRAEQRKDAGAERRTEMRPEDRASGVEEKPDKRLKARVWVWEIYLPKEQRIVSYVEGEDAPLYEHAWNGPEEGPYELLQFHPVPGEVLGVSPAMVLYNLHQFQNNLVRKLANQAERQKTISVTSKGDEESLKAITRANDGDAIALENPDAAKELRWGGADLANHNLALWSIATFDEHAGNLKTIAGLGPTAETNGQEQLIAGAANVRVDVMKRSVHRFAKALLKRHAWFFFYTQWGSVTVRIPATEDGSVSVYRTITPEDREGDFLDYHFDIDPYSMQEKSHGARFGELMEIVNSFVLPTAEMAGQSGYAFNFEGFAKEIIRLKGLKFDTLYKRLEPSVQDAGQEEEPEVPPLRRSHTVNERISRPGHTAAGRMSDILSSNAAIMAARG